MNENIIVERSFNLCKDTKEFKDYIYWALSQYGSYF